MKRSVVYSSFVLAIFLIWPAPQVDAAEQKPLSFPTRPYFSMFAASIDRLLDACETVFDSVDRRDLAMTLGERLKGFRDFAGIDRTKPLGIMRTWGDDRQDEIIFIPIDEIDELLTTFTYNNVVGHHEVRPNHYEIDRPGSPYHVLVRNEYAFFADSASTIQSLLVTPEQLTRGLRDRYDFALHLDLKQLPRPAKLNFIETLRAQIEPLLQEHDNEPLEAANLRKTVGRLILQLIQRAVLDTNTATIGGKLDPKTRVLSFEVVFDATRGSVWETGLNRLVSRRSEFTSLISPDVPAGVAVNLPLGGLIEQVLGSPNDPPAKNSNLEIGLQLVGTGIGQLSIIAALRGSEVSELNNAIPQLIVNAAKNGDFSSVNESFDIHHGIVLHSLIPRELPTWVIEMAGSDVEIIVGQGNQTIWIGIGNSETLPGCLKDAIELVDETPVARIAGPLVRARFQAKQLPELITSDLIIPAVDAESSNAAFERGGDGFSLTIEPVASGLRLRIEAEEGFVRLIGREWSKQVDDSKR